MEYTFNSSFHSRRFAGKAQEWPVMLTTAPFSVSVPITRALEVADLNGMQPSLVLWIPPALFLLGQVKMWTSENFYNWVHVCVCWSDGHVFWKLYLLIRVDFKCVCSSNISITFYGVNYVDILRTVCKTTGFNNQPDILCANVMVHNTAHLHTFSCRCQQSFNIFLIHTGRRGVSSE